MRSASTRSKGPARRRRRTALEPYEAAFLMQVPERVVLGMVERGKLSWGEDGIPTDEILFYLWGGENGASYSPLGPYMLERFARGHLQVPRLGPDDRPVEMNEVFAAHCSGRRITRVLVTE